MGITEVLTAPRSPWQNPYAERLIGSIRRECLKHFLILNARHLKRILYCYFRYYNRSRTHLSLAKQFHQGNRFYADAAAFGKRLDADVADKKALLQRIGLVK